MISDMLALSFLPTSLFGSIKISMCKLLFFNKIDERLSFSPLKPTNLRLSFN